jgi:hypothetical protein
VRITRKRAVFGAFVILVLALGGIAFAYFTQAGTGTGTAAVGNSSAIQLSATTAGNLYPGGATQDVAITVTNPGSGNQYVDTITVDSISADSGHSTCDVSLNSVGSAFTMANVTVAQDITHGADVVVHGTLAMNDTGVSQNTCKGASLTLHLSST